MNIDLVYLFFDYFKEINQPFYYIIFHLKKKSKSCDLLTISLAYRKLSKLVLGISLACRKVLVNVFVMI